MALGDAGDDGILIVCAVAGEQGDRVCDLIERGPTWAPSSAPWPVSKEARICPVSASTPMCSFRQDLRVFVPCPSCSHSPAPHSFSPVLSTRRTEHALGDAATSY